MLTRTIGESTSQGPLPTTKADLIAETKALVVSVNNTSRQVADNLATMRDHHDMTQEEIANAMGKIQAWVSTMLKWRDEGFKEETPFGAFSKAARKRKAAGGKATSRRKPADYQATDNQQETAEDGAKRRKAENAAADTATSEAETTSETKSTGSGSGSTTQLKKGSQAWWLSEFRVACQQYFPRMDAATLAEAKAFAAAWQPERHLKAVA